MLRHSKNKLFLYVIIVSVLLLLLVYLNMLSPALKKYNDLSEEILQEKQRISTLKGEAGEENTGTSDLNDNVFVPKNAEVDDLLLLLKNAASISKSTIVTIAKIGEEVSKDNQVNSKDRNQIEGINLVKMRILINSPSYTSLRSFIDTIDKSERIIAVDSVNLESAAGFNSREGSVQAEVTIESYYMDISNSQNIVEGK